MQLWFDDFHASHPGITHKLISKGSATANARPGQPADPLIKEFLRFVLSRQGQSDVANFGAIPLQADLASINLGKIR